MNNPKSKYKCKFCHFITSNKILAYKHIQEHFKRISLARLILYSDRYIKEINQTSSLKKGRQSANGGSNIISAKSRTKNDIEIEGYQSDFKYKCICRAGCNYTACNLNKLINHILKVHHPDKTIEWVKSNFFSLFLKQKRNVSKKKKKISYVGWEISPNDYNIHSLKKGDSGYVYLSRVNRDFDYDLDGRVK